MKLVTVTLLLSVLLLLSACSEKESVESYLYKAKSYIKKNQINESIIELKNAIRADINNSEARFLLGKTYLNEGNSVDAVKELERALKLKNDNELLIPLLARAYLLNNSDDAVISLENKDLNLKSEALTQYLAYKTMAALRSEQLEIAQLSVQQAKLVKPDSQYSQLAEAYLIFAESDFERASIIVKNILELSVDNPDMLMLQGQVAIAMQNYELAVKSFEHFLLIQPKSGIVQFLLADSLLKSGQYVKAEQYADRILALLSTQPFANYIKAMVRFQSKDYTKASEHAEVALSANFNQLNLKLVAGASAFYLKNWEQTNLHLSTVTQYLPPKHQAKKMLAISQLELGLINDINQTLSGFSSSSESDSQFITSLSYKLLELGAIDEAKTLVNKDRNTSGDAKATARQGVLKLMMNDPSGMLDLEHALKLNPELIEAELALAFAAVHSGDIEQAKKIAKKWEVEYPSKAGSPNLLAMIYIKEKNFLKAEFALKESLSKEENNIFALIGQVNLAIYQAKPELAKKRVNNLIILYPDSDKALRLYLDIYQNEKAVEFIVSSYKRDTSNINKALLASEALIKLKQIDNAVEILNSIKQDAKLPKRYWQLMLVVNKEQPNKLLSTLEEWRKISPFHIEPSILLVEYYRNKRDHTRAISTVNQALEYNLDNTTLQLVKMQLLLDTKELYKAKKLYKVLEKHDIKEALKLGMEGRILLLEKKFDLAISKLDEFYKAYPSAQNVIYLALAYKENGGEVNAIKALEGFLKNNDSDHVRAILANLYLASNRNKAIQHYEAISMQQPKNVVVNNNLAWLYMEKGDLSKALKFAEKAFSEAPEVANVVDTYGKILLKSGDKRKALEKAEQALALVDGKDIDIHLNYIEALLANSRKNQAKKALEMVKPKTDEQKNKVAKLAELL